MTDAARPAVHGKDHLPGGPDPIGLSGGTYAWLGRTTSQTIVSGTPTNPDFTSGGTNDSASFNPDQVNNRIEFLQTGLYIVTFDFVPTLSGNTWSLRLVCNASSPMASSIDLPEEVRLSGAAGNDPYYSRTTIMIVDSLTGYSPPEVHGLMQHSTGSDKAVTKSMLRVIRAGDYTT